MGTPLLFARVVVISHGLCCSLTTDVSLSTPTLETGSVYDLCPTKNITLEGLNHLVYKGRLRPVHWTTAALLEDLTAPQELALFLLWRLLHTVHPFESVAPCWMAPPQPFSGEVHEHCKDSGCIPTLEALTDRLFSHLILYYWSRCGKAPMIPILE